MSAGIYALEVSKAGFATHRAKEIRLAVGESATIAVQLQIGTARTVITVVARDSTLLDAESNAIGTVVDSERVQQLPLNGRNFLQLALLSGGAAELSPVVNILDINVGHPGRAVVLPGTLPYSVGYSVNGINVRGVRDGELALNVSLAGIDQFKVQNGFLLPDQGPNAATVNIATRKGTNEIHGEVFEFLRNRVLDARSFFAVKAEDLKRNQFGFALGGPLRKNRVWFHGFYEGLREITAFSQAGYSPTAAMFGGDFAATGRTIYDPAGFDPSSGTRTPFPGSAIPPARFNPVARNLSAYYLPGTSLASLPGNVYGNPRNTLNDDQVGLRLDASWNPRQHLYGQFFRQDSPVVKGGLYPLSGLGFPNHADVAMVEHTWSVSPRAVNSFRAGFVRAIALGGNEARDRGPLLESIGIWNTVDNRGTGAVTLAGYSPFGNSNGDVGNNDNTWQVDDGFHAMAANHSIAFGAGLRLRRGWHLNSNVRALGQLNFTPTFTAQLLRNAQGQFAAQSGTGDSWADFLLGLPISGQLSGVPVIQYRATQLLPYFQDTWKITRALTLNYGLAWHLETPPDPQDAARGTVHGFDPATGLFTYAALGQITPQVMSTDRNNIAPRFGLAWRPRFLKDTVIRAGAGVYYSEFPWLVAQYSVIVSPPFAAGQSFANPASTPTPAYQLGTNVYPVVPPATLDGNYAAGLPAGTVGSAIDPGIRTAYVSQWNASLQRGLGSSDSLEVTYLGSSGHRLLNRTDIAQCRPGPDLYCAAATKPWPRYAAVIWLTGDGNSSYQGLVAKYQHRAAYGLDLRIEHTLAKVLTNAWQGYRDPIGQIATCRRCDKGPAGFDVRNRLAASAVWQVPLGRGRRFRANASPILNTAIGGWGINGIVTFATGQPLFFTSPSASLFLPQLPNRICDGRRAAGSGSPRDNGFLWFDPACFPIPSSGYFGNSGRTVVNGPGVNNWDLGLEKFFPLSADESVKVVLRAEAFNAWNHTQFQQPNADAGAGLNFGRISATRPPRLIQLGLKVTW